MKENPLLSPCFLQPSLHSLGFPSQQNFLNEVPTLPASNSSLPSTLYPRPVSPHHAPALFLSRSLVPFMLPNLMDTSWFSRNWLSVAAALSTTDHSFLKPSPLFPFNLQAPPTQTIFLALPLHVNAEGWSAPGLSPWPSKPIPSSPSQYLAHKINAKTWQRQPRKKNRYRSMSYLSPTHSIHTYWTTTICQAVREENGEWDRQALCSQQT